MDYKLLRALSIFLQAGLVVLLILLISLVFVSCTTATVNQTTLQSKSEIRKDIMEQRFFNDVRQQRQQYKVLCITKEALNTKQLSKTQRLYSESINKKA